MKTNKMSPFRIKRRLNIVESRGYDKDSITTTTEVLFDIVRNDKLVETFNSISSAVMYINSKTSLGKKLLDKMKTNNYKINKLNSAVEQIKSKNDKIIRQLTSTNMKRR